jgi:hypothetical protein
MYVKILHNPTSIIAHTKNIQSHHGFNQVYLQGFSYLLNCKILKWVLTRSWSLTYTPRIFIMISMKEKTQTTFCWEKNKEVDARVVATKFLRQKKWTDLIIMIILVQVVSLSLQDNHFVGMELFLEYKNTVSCRI